MQIHCFQHVAFEHPGLIAQWADMHHHHISYTYFFEDHYTWPNLDDVDALLIMGGYMNVDEEERFPWLVQEKQFIKQAITAGKKVMGICLGAQLIATSLGSKVYPGTEKEIGFFPLDFTGEALSSTWFQHFKNPYPVFHWHGDTFHLPPGARLLAATPVCPHQAFQIGNHVLAFQFHVEMTESIIESIMLMDGQELEQQGDFIAKREQIRSQFHHLPQIKNDLFILLDQFFG